MVLARQQAHFAKTHCYRDAMLATPPGDIAARLRVAVAALLVRLIRLRLSRQD